MKHLKNICLKIYNESGVDSVVEYINDRIDKEPLTKSIVSNLKCDSCSSETPHWNGVTCLCCGNHNSNAIRKKNIGFDTANALDLFGLTNE